MDVKSFFELAREKAADAWNGAGDLLASTASVVGSGIGFARQAIPSSWLLGSTERSLTQYDEKHYFLVPFKAAECGYSLYSMRCLPDGVPPVNELPKRRIIHLPSEHGRRMLEALLQRQVAGEISAKDEGSAWGDRLMSLADQLDDLDRKAFHGALLIGGLVALANPVAGGVLAAKAMLPSLGLMLSKYGLQQAGESLNERNVQRRLRPRRRTFSRSLETLAPLNSWIPCSHNWNFHWTRTSESMTQLSTEHQKSAACSHQRSKNRGCSS